jgi:hypothetical protein
MASPLENLTGPGKPLRIELPDAKEFSGLKRAALARLADSAKVSNFMESRFDLAYNAAEPVMRLRPPRYRHEAGRRQVFSPTK